MKKVLIAFLLVALCFGAFAEAKVTGAYDVRAGFGDGYNTVQLNKLRLLFGADIGDYNKMDLKLFLEKATGVDYNLIGDPDVNPANFFFFSSVQAFTVATDWGKLFGLPVTVKTALGYHAGTSDSVFGNGDAYYLSDIYWENQGGVWLDGGIAAKLSVGYEDLVTVDVATTLGNSPSTTGIYVGATVDFAPVAVKLGYVTYKTPVPHFSLDPNKDNPGNPDGVFGAEVNFGMEVSDGMDLGAVLALNYDIASEGLGYSGGVSFAAFGAKVVVVGKGNKDAFQNLGIQANYMVTDAFKIDAAAGLNLDATDPKEAFMGAGLGVVYTVGGVNYALGYIFSPEDTQSFNWRGSSTDDKGGMYLRVNFNF